MAEIGPPEPLFPADELTFSLWGIPHGTDVQQILDRYSPYGGTILDCSMGPDGTTCEIMYEWPYQVRAVVERVAMAEQDEDAQVRDRVLARTAMQRDQDRVRTVYLTGLSDLATPESLKIFLQEELDVLVDGSPVLIGRTNGSVFGFVRFLNVFERDHAMVAAIGKFFLGRELVLRSCVFPRS